LILFCDTSALVKLYVVESGSDWMQEEAADAAVIAVSRLAWVELHAALARRGREAPVDQPLLEAIKDAFATDWAHFAVVEVNQELVELASEYADGFGLRAYDAVQLASASRLREQGDDLRFACFDRRLNQAAGLLGMAVTG
jgi:predicted nucleic acid-binding protein